MKNYLLPIASLCLLVAVMPLTAEDKPGDKAASTTTKKTYKNVGPEGFDKLRQNTNTVVLDVRTKDEYDQAHIPGAVLLDFNSPNFDQELAKLDKSKTYLVHCAAGGRSARAAGKMEKLNFPSVFNLEGGLTAWKKEGKPVEPKK